MNCNGCTICAHCHTLTQEGVRCNCNNKAREPRSILNVAAPGPDPRVEEMARELYIKLAHFNPWVVDQDPPRALGDLRDACYKSARVFYGVDECSTK